MHNKYKLNERKSLISKALIEIGITGSEPKVKNGVTVEIDGCPALYRKPILKEHLEFVWYVKNGDQMPITTCSKAHLIYHRRILIKNGDAVILDLPSLKDDDRKTIQ